jgi:hypothetical protein
MKIRLVASVVIFCCLSIAHAATTYSVSNVPSGDSWISHEKKDILPFWMSPDAIGDSVHGFFPTFRYRDGKAVDLMAFRDEFVKDTMPMYAYHRGSLAHWSMPMLSRQIYAYCVGFHMTGDQKALANAREALGYLMKYGMSPDSIFYIWQDWEGASPALECRTGQALGYCLLGPSFYYYITRDTTVLPVIFKMKKFIFSYLESQKPWYHLLITKARGDQYSELTAQLDQLNTYLFLMAEIIPDRYRAEWKNDCITLSRVIYSHFYNQSRGDFDFAIPCDTTPEAQKYRSDFGHSAKAAWYLYMIGKHFNDTLLEESMLMGADSLLNQAFSKKHGRWIRGSGFEGPDSTIDWWMYDELDQFAATIALADPSVLDHLIPSYSFYFTHVIDTVYGEAWQTIDTSNAPVKEPLKTNMWKNGYHSSEHTLVGYITSQALHKKQVELYYAFSVKPKESDIHPYFYRAKIVKQDKVKTTEAKLPFPIVRVTFANVR